MVGGNSDVEDKLHFIWPCSAITAQNEEHINHLIHAKQLMVVTILESIGFFVAESVLYQIVILCSLVLNHCSFHKK